MTNMTKMIERNSSMSSLMDENSFHDFGYSGSEFVVSETNESSITEDFSEEKDMQPELTPTKVPKSVSDKLRFFESAMEDQHKPTQKSEKVFSFLSKDEVEKLKQEEERKIASLRHEKNVRLLDASNDNDILDAYDRSVETDQQLRANSTKQESYDDDNTDNVHQIEGEPFEAENLSAAPSHVTKPAIVAPSKPATLTTKTATTTSGDVIIVLPPTTQAVIKKPSLLPKPKVKVVIPPALLQQQQKQQQPETLATRIPVRTAKAEKRAATAKLAAFGDSDEVAITATPTSQQFAATVAGSKAMINAEKRASWRAARLRSLEQGAAEAQDVIKNMVKITDDLLTCPPEQSIESCEGPVIVREREKILDEKIVRRTEEVACPVTGRPQLRTVEYIEKIIETEVETCREKIISLELQEPEKGDTQHAVVAPVATKADSNIRLEDEKPPKELVVKKTTAEAAAENDQQHKDDEADEDDEDDYDDEDEEEDAASIVTVHANDDKLFLRSDEPLSSLELDVEDFDNSMYGPASVESSDGGSSTKVAMKPAPIKLRQTLAREVLAPGTRAITTTISSTTQSIVEVVNPLITGEGQVKHIAVSRSKPTQYHSFDADDVDEAEAAYNLHSDELVVNDDEDDEHELPTSITQVLRSETFVLPTRTSTGAPSQELSLNAKMKNVLEELLENERVKLNLQKSLEDKEEDENEYDDDDDDDADDAADGDEDQVDCDDNKDKHFNNRLSGKRNDKNGNQDLFDDLIRDSNRNTLRSLAAKLQGDDDEENDNENDNDNDDDDEVLDEDEESEESDDSDSDEEDDEDDDDDEHAVHMTFVDGCQVIENLNAQTPLKLQKSQTYTTMKEAASAMAADMISTNPKEELKQKQQEVPEMHDAVEVRKEITSVESSEGTLEKLQAEQQILAALSQQLRRSVEDLLIDTGVDESATTSTTTAVKTVLVISPTHDQQEEAKKSSTKVSPPDGISSGEALFNRLLSSGGELKQIFDEQTGESVTTTTETDTTDGNNTIITTTTTTISNVVTSGIPRAIFRVDAGRGSSKGGRQGDGGDVHTDDASSSKKQQTTTMESNVGNENVKLHQQQQKQQYHQKSGKQKRKGKNAKK